MKSGFRRLGVGICFTLAACSNEAPPSVTATTSVKSESGINPVIVVGAVDPSDRDALSAWISETVSLLKSPAFETNFKRASVIYPEIYVSKTQDIISSDLLLTRLKTQDPYLTALWWPKTYVVLSGETATRLEDRRGFGFDAPRNAGAGPYPENEIATPTGEIALGRLHFARYVKGDVVEKSCAINTMAHEISHTLSDRPDRFWMHILDSQRHATPPRGVFEASYFIGSVAQCTYLETVERIEPSEFETCIRTFSDMSMSSRFRSIACDDFPGDKSISPTGRLSP